LGGGLPIGGICEFTGPASAGRTSLALSVLSEATVDSACAYIDVSNSLDARSAAAAGVRLKNLLWVRFSEAQEQRHKPTQPNQTGKPVAPNRDGADRSTQHHGIRHPRTETKGIDRDLEKMLVQKAETRLKKMEGTPGYPNQRLSLAAAPEEQVAYEHFNARRADASDPLRQIDRRAADEARERANSPASHSSALATGQHRHYPITHRDVRATDLSGRMTLCSSALSCKDRKVGRVFVAIAGIDRLFYTDADRDLCTVGKAHQHFAPVYRVIVDGKLGDRLPNHFRKLKFGVFHCCRTPHDPTD
jgi:recombination protein RecA